MNLGELINSFRNAIGEQSTRRFTTSIVTEYANRAQMQVALEVDFPEATQIFPAIQNQREYQLPELLKILRVYITAPGGVIQELIPTDIPTLEGDYLHQFDNSSGQVQGSPTQTSQWQAQQSAAFPGVNNGFTGAGSAPVPTNSAWSANKRPAWYMRGGFIGIVPAPISSGQYSLVVDYIPSPPILNISSDTSLFPAVFKDAIIWQMVAYARYSDNQSAYQAAIAMYQDQMASKVRPWLDRMQAYKPKTFVPRTVRSQYRRRRGDVL